jgi:hypothetical protein
MSEAAAPVERFGLASRPLDISATTLLVAVALLGILRFSPTFAPTVVSVYWADVAMVGLGALWFLHVRSMAWTRETGWLATTGSWFLILLVVAILGSSLVLQGGVPAQENLIQAFRFTAYGVVLLFLCDLAVRGGSAWERTAGTLVLVSLTVNVVVVGLQLLHPPGIGPTVLTLWGDDKLRTLASGYPRVYGTFFNANWFGVYVAWVVTFTAATWRTLGVRPFRAALVVAAGLALLAASASRTGIIASVIGLAVTLALSVGRSGRSARGSRFTWIVVLGIVFTSIAGIVAAVRTLELDRFGRRFAELSLLVTAPGDVEILTFDARVRAWQQAAEIFRSAPIFGIGGSTATSGLAPHNGYLAMLMNFGAVGAGALALFVAGVVVMFCTGLGGDPTGRRLRAWFLGFTAALAVAMLAGDFIYTSRLVFLWLVIIALGAGHAQLTRQQRAEETPDP